MGSWFVFDVESVGLHGEGFAVGWVHVTDEGEELRCGYAACDSALCRAGAHGDREWIAENLPMMRTTAPSAYYVRAAFWEAWQVARAKGARMAADVPWPVEARFLLDCIADQPSRAQDAPYPLYDVAMFLPDPLATHERTPNELPAHHPLKDARQSARILLEHYPAEQEQ